MARYLYGDDPEPEESVPAGLLLVPVRPGPGGDVLRLFRTPLGARTAVAFTSATHLSAVLGPDQRSITLAEPALRNLAGALGIATLTVDPQLVAAPAPALEEPDHWRVPRTPARLAARPRVA
ncbi:SAV_915 family protein [Streptacidiphilus jiangxiensis]|uniref:SseB protein N-terminal domain-containing protein n=1 Tax=Streptacidiphilus jiangxiensis TaxID=235985 RepID=A0A1H7NBG5_STRJI|nr:SAV_915 family protein [Streptacidiphilus jiangxiensis]SEL20833.1 hypothetical protein SAMN05414137_106302 [Streptacidiphilus jiangxiensis]